MVKRSSYENRATEESKKKRKKKRVKNPKQVNNSTGRSTLDNYLDTSNLTVGGSEEGEINVQISNNGDIEDDVSVENEDDENNEEGVEEEAETWDNLEIDVKSHEICDCILCNRFSSKYPPISESIFEAMKQKIVESQSRSNLSLGLDQAIEFYDTYIRSSNVFVGKDGYNPYPVITKEQMYKHVMTTFDPAYHHMKQLCTLRALDEEILKFGIKKRNNTTGETKLDPKSIKCIHDSMNLQMKILDRVNKTSKTLNFNGINKKGN